MQVINTKAKTKYEVCSNPQVYLDTYGISRGSASYSLSGRHSLERKSVNVFFK